ncbi:carboxylating nicotinate-nucleotide diphosphorylase [Sporosarcina oncorhynchi]|uniref:nicotinate-nucleotide diphosphorylase (carboxylating) n=1 Tax=Sporosarcina oncorhynchi TaxID=3056444 RepID=A0ABZ0L2W5_9BACL|nr:carboxylating nicotinate-nucleotide diphosphorylase [Sporosarcina sp. T2O-4]WOV86947.1 carboxylating nicotinate-nucleotide diphosphorylase [Sporosarcina sp. T2O-4]
MNGLKLRLLVEQFLLEDIGAGDLSADSIFLDKTKGKMVFVAKESGVFCGTAIFKMAFQLLDQHIQIEVMVKDGEEIRAGQELAVASGNVAALLSGERVVLNLIQRMSGIATLTKAAVNELDNESIRICDTRKTTPGLRMLEKYAVRCGGGYNHRHGLYDAVMIKDNHIAFAGSITRAVELARRNTGHMVNIEVETETKEQVVEAVESGADVIMFDNRLPEEIEEFVKLVPAHITTEASGGIQLDNLKDYRYTGVNYISLGFLTHSYKAIDISANVLIEEEH